MALAFGLVFWGLVFTILDFRINRFDLLPDLLGYLLLVVGCVRLSRGSDRFQIAALLSGILAVFEVASLAGNLGGIDLAMVPLILDLLMMWMLMGGCMKVAEEWQRPDLLARASNRRIAYVVILGSCYLIPFLLGGPNSAGLLVVMFVVCLFVVLVLILQFIHQMKIASNTHGW